MKKIAIFYLFYFLLLFSSIAYTADQSTTESVWDKTLWPKDFNPSDFEPSPFTTIEGQDIYIDTLSSGKKKPSSFEAIQVLTSIESGTATNEFWYYRFNPSDFEPAQGITIETE